MAQVLARMKAGRARGRGRHSPLYRWFRANHAQLVETFEADPPSWPSLAEALGESGITDGDNKAPTPQGARTTWYRVRRDIAAVRQARDATSSQAVAAADATPSVIVPPPGEQDGNAGANPRRFRPVKLRGWEKEGEQPSRPVTASTSPSPEPGVDVDDVLSRFMPGAAKRD